MPEVEGRRATKFQLVADSLGNSNFANLVKDSSVLGMRKRVVLKVQISIQSIYRTAESYVSLGKNYIIKVRPRVIPYIAFYSQ